jgi:hypothetical protein
LGEVITLTDKNRSEEEQLALRLVDSLIEYAISTSLLKGEEREVALSKGVETAKELAHAIQRLVEGRDEYIENVLMQLVAQKLPDPKILSSFGSFSDDLKHMIEKGVDESGLSLSGREAIKLETARTGTSETRSRKGKRSGRPARFGRRTGSQARKMGAPVAVPGTPLTDETLEKAATMPVSGGDPGEPLPSEREEPSRLDGEIGADAAKPAVAEDQYRNGLTKDETMPGQRAKTAADPVSALIAQVFPGKAIVSNHSYHRDIFPYYVPELKLALIGADQKLKPSTDLCCRKEGITVVRLLPEALGSSRSLLRVLGKAGIK